MQADAVRANLLTRERRRKLLILIFVWGLAVLAALPAIRRWTAVPPSDGRLLRYFMYVFAGAICVYIYGHESRHLARSRSALLVFLIFLLTSIVNNVHKVMVDNGAAYFPGYASNTQWQGYVNDLVIQLRPEWGALPHVYRFLPNSIVRWLQLGGLGYEPARDIYRLIFGILLFYAIYKFARLYTSYLGAILAMLFIAIVYPVSFEHYAGQLTDPLSHLSFVLAFIFLETEEFAFFLTALLIGSLAKETVLALAGYYVLFGWKERHYWLKAVTACFASVGCYIGVRWYILHSSPVYAHISRYAQISDAPPDIAWRNLYNTDWPIGFFLTVGAFVPFVALAWRQTPRSLKQLSLFLLPVLFVSGVFFSWLVEMRNFMPLVFVLAVIAARYLVGLGTESAVTAPPSSERVSRF